MNDPLDTLPGYLFRRISGKFQDIISSEMSEIGLRPSEASTLLVIEANPKVPPSAIGNLLGIKRANMVPIVTKLEAAGYIERTALDGRSYGLGFTKSGVELCALVKAKVRAHEQAILARVPENLRADFISTLAQMWDDICTEENNRRSRDVQK